MEVGWGAKLGEQTDGLDILGIRGLDQAMEASLVVGITTISQRGRYLTILPWALGEFFSADAGSGVEAFDPERLKRYLFRVQFMILASTAVDEGPGEPGGALGSVTYANDIAALQRGEPISFPEHGRGAMLGTYFGPCSAMGLLRGGDAHRPYVVTQRGRAIWEARNAQLDRELVAVVLNGEDQLDPANVRTLTPHFSLKRLSPLSQEATLLRDALVSPWAPVDPGQAKRVKETYDRFNGTIAWLRSQAVQGLAAEDLLSRQCRSTLIDDDYDEPVQRSWAEFEWRRRVHFALELVMSAITDTLLAKTAASIREVVAAWVETAPSKFLAELWPEVSLAVDRPGNQAVVSVPTELAVQGLGGNWSGLSGGGERALAGFALLAAAARQSTKLRESGLFGNWKATGERALAVIDEAADEAFLETMVRLTEVVVRAHLTNTFRKMEGGQKCSLRFFPEGSRLRTTGEIAGAGRSGPRLWNVVRILRDAGIEGLGPSA